MQAESASKHVPRHLLGPMKGLHGAGLAAVGDLLCMLAWGWRTAVQGLFVLVLPVGRCCGFYAAVGYTQL